MPRLLASLAALILLAACQMPVAQFQTPRLGDAAESRAASSSLGGKVVMGYMPDWAGDVTTVQYSKLTHIGYAFLQANTDGSLNLSGVTISRMQQLISLAHAAGTKVLISVGGWNNASAMTTAMRNSTARTALANNILGFVSQYGLDGVDLDWEGPANSTDGTYYNSIMQTLYNSLHPSGKLTTTAVGQWFGDNIPASAFAYMDFAGLMAYDNGGLQHSDYNFAVSNMTYWIGRGLPAAKAVLGVPFYGYDTNRTGQYAYNVICANDPNAQNNDYSSYLGGVYYNGIPTITQKTQYAKDYGGVMIWELSEDAPGTKSLLSAIYSTLATSGTSPTNLALGKTVTANGFNQTYAPANANDGNTSTYWEGTSNSYPSVLSVSLGANANITSVVVKLNPTWGTRTQTITVLGHNTSTSTFSTLVGATSYTFSQNTNVVTIPVTASVSDVQLQFTANSGAVAGQAAEFEVWGTTGSSSPTETAYPSGTNWPINNGAVIQAENFDNGGEGVAYHDNEAANQGGQYRTAEGVDIETSSDTGGGYDIGWTNSGEWLKYTTNVTAGTYNITVRLASGISNPSTLALSLDGVSLGTVQAPATGGWQTWQDVTLSNVTLTGGNGKILRLDIGGGYNINSIKFVSVGPTETAYPNGVNWPIANGAVIQAENFDNGGEGVAYHDGEAANLGGQYRTGEGVDIEATTDTGGGYDVGWNSSGEWLKYTTNVTAGTYNITVRLASGSSNPSTLALSLDGVSLGTVQAPATGGWQTWQDVTLNNVTLAGGNGKILRIDSGTGYNINSIKFTTSGPTETAYPNGVNWPINAGAVIQAENFDNGGEGVAYHDTEAANQGGQYRTTEGVDIETSSDTGGGYDIGWTNSGEWLKYTTNVTAGTYDIVVRLASGISNPSTLALSLDGVALGTVQAPATGGWQTWQDVTLSNVTLTGGSGKILRLDIGGGYNINSIRFAAPGGGAPDFGPNVKIIDPSMSQTTVQNTLNSVYSIQQNNQFGSDRYAVLFKPGTYNVDVNVGFYTQIAGLGASPNQVSITNNLHSDAYLPSDNATCNFWRGVENFSVTPVSGTVKWAVAQATPFRRMHVVGSMVLSQNSGWSSGGYIADTKVDGTVNNGTQQQWITRNSQIGSWSGQNWNEVFVGVSGAPSGASWPNPPYTVIGTAPVEREKPFLTIDGSGNYSVLVPSLTTGSSGITWAGGSTPGTSIPISQFYIAKAGTDSAATMNSALASGKHLLLTPGVYHLNDTLRVNNANTVVLGLGFATLVPDNGVVAMSVADVDGVKIAGILFDAGTVNSPILLEVGPTGSGAGHSANPTSLSDLFFRVGGATVGKASVSLKINSNDVIGDHFWIWRADHGNGGTVGWTINTAANGLVVNGANVTIYGLFVEHYQQYQTLWNGNGGKVYFYQSEIPYDVPDQGSWMNGGANGFASYKVADSVTSHQSYGLGVYCYFNVNPSVKLANAIECPQSGLNGAMFHNMTTVSLGGVGEITHVLDGWGGTANAATQTVRLIQ